MVMKLEWDGKLTLNSGVEGDGNETWLTSPKGIFFFLPFGHPSWNQKMHSPLTFCVPHIEFASTQYHINDVQRISLWLANKNQHAHRVCKERVIEIERWMQLFGPLNNTDTSRTPNATSLALLMLRKHTLLYCDPTQKLHLHNYTIAIKSPARSPPPFCDLPVR